MLDSEEEEASELEGQAEALIVFKFHSSMLNKTLQLRSTVASWRSKIICVPRTSSTATFFYTTSQVVEVSAYRRNDGICHITKHTKRSIEK